MVLLVVKGSDNEHINNVYTRQHNINERSYWISSPPIKNAAQYYIYMADPTVNQWNISNGVKILYRAYSQNFYPPFKGWQYRKGEEYSDSNLIIQMVY
jgi:hypothetical protein